MRRRAFGSFTAMGVGGGRCWMLPEPGGGRRAAPARVASRDPRTMKRFAFDSSETETATRILLSQAEAVGSFSIP
jgi:hypothetical protein